MDFLGKITRFLAIFALGVFAQGDIQITGKVTDASGAAVSGAQVELEVAGLSATTGADGSFSLGEGLSIDNQNLLLASQLNMSIKNGILNLNIFKKSAVEIKAYSLGGKEIFSLNQLMGTGMHSIQLPSHVNGVVIFNLKLDGKEARFKVYSNSGFLEAVEKSSNYSADSKLRKEAAAMAANVDVLKVTKDGFLDHYRNILEPSAAGLEISLTAEGTLEPFSFFVTSLKALQELSGSEDGFGGDFRFGETGPAAGLRGADKICAAIAETTMPGATAKGWRAFLSATDDGNGEVVNAIDRIGEGPWYDRLGRTISENKAGLQNTRPDGDEAAVNDLPNEEGVPNQDPDGTGPVDNHHTLTGSDANGELYSPDIGNTCNDWTSSEGETGSPRTGLSWPRNFGGGGGGGGGIGGDLSSNWISAWDAYGCAPGISLIQDGAGDRNILTVGEGGGYGGFYCFALNP